jgi:hypothetical protein
VRGITATIAVLFGIGFLASIIELPCSRSIASPQPVEERDEWRRTQSGWERQNNWGWTSKHTIPEPRAWRVHPITIASLQLLVSVFALLLAYPGPAVESAMVRYPQIQFMNNPG